LRRLRFDDPVLDAHGSRLRGMLPSAAEIKGAGETPALQKTALYFTLCVMV
jgi:hypothetical protein